MKKSDSIDALMESAIRIFSRDGYEGASLRDIAAHAGVPLSTIHLYFGSKLDLYVAVEQKAWAEVDRERSTLLHDALTRAGSEPAPLSDLIHALALPVVKRALGTSEGDMARIFLIRSRVSQSRNIGDAPLLSIADRSVVRWIDAMTRICPTLTRQDVVWAFSFCVGLIYSWQLIDHRYDRLIGQDSERTVDGVTSDIVVFGCAGVAALIKRRAVAALDARP